MKRILVCVAVFVVCAAQLKGQTTVSAMSPADSFNAALRGAEGQVMALVRSVPEERYGFAPSQAIFAPAQKTNYEGVRTFGGLVLHVAQANYGMAARFSGLKPDVDPASLSGLKGKAEIDAALAASFAFVHRAIGTLTAENAWESVGGANARVVMIAANLAHTSDEYGQMVEYARMNGIVPPPSGPPPAPKK